MLYAYTGRLRVTIINTTAAAVRQKPEEGRCVCMCDVCAYKRRRAGGRSEKSGGRGALIYGRQ